MRLILTSAIFAMSLPAFGSQPAFRSKASPWLLQQYKTPVSADTLPTALIYLKDQADLSSVAPEGQRGTRIAAVFNKLVETATRSQASLSAWLTNEGLTHRSLYISNMIVADKVTQTQLDTILQRDDVLRVVGNPQIKNKLPSTMVGPTDEVRGPGANLIRIGATKVWSDLHVRGENIVVAGQDTGVRWDHAALKPHYRGWDGTTADHSYSWHDAVHKTIGGGSSCGYDLTTPCDDHDHGTHTLGTVVGDDSNGNQIGVAPGAKWIGCRNMDSGLGNPEMYTECFQWFLAPWPQKGDAIKDARPEMAPHVINNSWGCPRSEGCEGGEFERILTAMKAAGIFVVASAGNEGPACGTIKDGPAFHTDLVLSVGAVDHRNDAIASFSSRGPSVFDNKVGPDISAPGVNVRSAVRSGGYAEFGWSGTSMAGPHLVGVVALLWSAKPQLIGNIEATETALQSTSEAKTSSQTCGGVAGTARPNNTFGYGIVNAFEVTKP